MGGGKKMGVCRERERENIEELDGWVAFGGGGNFFEGKCLLRQVRGESVGRSKSGNLNR